MYLEELINGSLLGDASVRMWKNKYFYYQYSAKDKNFLEWIKQLLDKFGLQTYIVLNNKISHVYGLGFYINNKRSSWLLNLRNDWYKQENTKTVKTFPSDLNITSTTLFFWYLGDGCLVRRKNDKNRVPFIVLATNCFSKEDIEILMEKLKGLGLTFYPVKYKSGFTGKECGFCLYSNTQDGTPYRFFKLIGLECPGEIANFSTGSKGIYHEEKFFKDKWPTEEDWIKIISNIKEIGPMLRERRLQLGLSQNRLGKRLGIRRENIRDVELSKRHFRVENLRKILESLNLDVWHLLKVLNTRNL